MQFKSFDELSIQDNFIFEKVMREKSICKELVERLLEISIRDIAYIETEKNDGVRSPFFLESVISIRIQKHVQKKWAESWEMV